MKIPFVFAILVFISSIALPATTYVPDDYPAIQDAINASLQGDTIIVRTGTYVENIDFIGKAITVKSEEGPGVTTIDGNANGSVAVFRSRERKHSILEGFTLTNGRGTIGILPSDRWGGGIYCFNSSPVIRGNRIIGNYADLGGGIGCCGLVGPEITDNVIRENGGTGGGIYCSAPGTTIRNNVITGNHAYFAAGGIYCGGCSPLILDNVISDNDVWQDGGGIKCDDASPAIVNNRIIGNVASWGGGICLAENSAPVITNNSIHGNEGLQEGGGLFCWYSSFPIISNTIIWDNCSPSGPEIWIGSYWSPSVVAIGHSDVAGGLPSVYVDSGCTLNWGAGMIDADPLFAGPADNDFHLTMDSPCRNKGDNSAVTRLHDFEGDPRFALGAADMGADEFYCHLYYIGDVIPGSKIAIKVVGYPTSPVTLFLGSGIADPPHSTPYGKFWLNWPPLWQGNIGAVPGTGVLTLPAIVPSGSPSGSRYPFQALVGPWGGPWSRLTNLETLVVE